MYCSMKGYFGARYCSIRLWYGGNNSVKFIKKKHLPMFIGYRTAGGERKEKGTRSSYLAYTKFEFQLVYRRYSFRDLLCTHGFVTDDSSPPGRVD